MVKGVSNKSVVVVTCHRSLRPNSTRRYLCICATYSITGQRHLHHMRSFKRTRNQQVIFSFSTAIAHPLFSCFRRPPSPPQNLSSQCIAHMSIRQPGHVANITESISYIAAKITHIRTGDLRDSHQCAEP